jgi:hypothetical protein
MTELQLRTIQYLLSAAKGYLYYDNPAQLPDGKSDQWWSLRDQITFVEKMLERIEVKHDSQT